VRRLAGPIAIACCVAIFAATGLAQVRPIGEPIRPPIPAPHPRLSPVPEMTTAPTFAPLPTAMPGSGSLPGSFVPLSQLPPLPPKTVSNTVGARTFRPMAASGATVIVTSSGSANCALSVGEIFATGCTVNWRSSGLIAGHTYQDYYISPAVANGQGGTTAGGTYTTASGSSHSQTLSTNGVWVFAVLDRTTGLWATVTYADVGTADSVRVYQDPYHTQETYQFDASSSGYAYVYATNLTASDFYVVYIESTSVDPQCVFVAPAQSPTYTAGQLCNPGNSPGVQAPNGALNVTFPISGSTAAGTYSVVIFDKTSGLRVGQTQISITGSSGFTLSLTQDASSANPSPAPAPAGVQSTIFAWDSANDRSTSGVTLGAQFVPGGSYIWTISDPTGQAYSSPTQALSGTANYTFTFSNFAQTPGNYIPKAFSAALYNTTSKTVYAVQTFQVVGYYVVPTLDGTSSLSISQGGSTTATLTLTNSSANRYGSDNGDSFAKLAFSTGTTMSPTSGGQGLSATLNNASVAACAAPGCTQTVTDSAGNAWVATDVCATGGATACVIELDPVSASTVLAPGASISLSNVGFANSNGSSCANGSSCSMISSVLPQHGQTWSSTSSFDAYLPVYISAGNALTATASVSLSGASANGYTSTGVETVEAHLYRPNTTHAHYHRTSPYAITSSDYNILAFTITNNSNKNEDVIAIGLPGSYASLNALNYFAIDPNLNNATTSRWAIDTSCSDAASTFGRKWLCLDGTGNFGPIVSLAKNSSQTIYLDMNAAVDSFDYTDWQISLADPLVFSATASGTATIPIGPTGSFSVDGLAYAQYSLDQSMMQANFQPSAAGSNSTAAETVVVANTPTSADPNPDYLDDVLIAIPSGTNITTTPTVNTSGWQYLGRVLSGGNYYYWFSVCSNGQLSSTYLPPTTTPLTTRANAVPTCTAGALASALAPGQTLSVGMQVPVVASTINAKMYAHGANGGGWTTGHAFSLTVQAVATSVGFSAAGGYPTATAVATNAVPSIGGNADPTFGNAYTYSVKNTSSATNVTSFAVIVPGLDINSVNATDSSGQTWVLTGAPTLSGNVDGCTVTGSASATTAGGNGYINIGGGSCNLLPGHTIAVNFTAMGPQAQGDSYQFSTQNINGSGTLDSSSSQGTVGTESWIGDTRVAVALTIGLNLAVNPSNPGPGGSTPSVSCVPCSFSGSTVDLGTIGNNATATYGDILRASVYITSSSATTYNLSVGSSNNPARSPAAPTNELLTEVDSAASSQGLGLTADATSFTVVPTAGSLQLMHGTTVPNRTSPYDVIESFQLNIGSESISTQISTLTYTLVVN